MDTDKKIDMALNICNHGRYRKVKFFSVYPFTTENISAYIDMFDLKDKSLLTVGSSGDQVLNAILMGCKDIVLFDICPFAKEYFYLKRAAIMAMNRDEYLNFFCYKNYPKLFINNRKAFLDSSFYGLLTYLEEIEPEACYFWCELLKNDKGIHLRKSLFSTDEYEGSLLKIMNRYLESDRAYNLLRENLAGANVKFIYDNIFNIDEMTNYDNIFLSNIAAYYKLEEFKYLFDKCTNLLNDNGKMLVSYLYDTDLDSEYTPGEDEIYNLPKVFEMLAKEIEITSFAGNSGLRFNDKRSRDSVLTYKKSKKI